MELELDVARQNRTDPRFRPSPRSRVSFFHKSFRHQLGTIGLKSTSLVRLLGEGGQSMN